MRFSLRTIAIMLLMASAAFALVAYLRSPIPVIAKVEKLGGGVSIKYKNKVAESLQLRRLAVHDYIRIESNEITNSDVIAISQLDGIVSIDLRSDKITDESLHRMGEAVSLRSVSVASSSITDDGLAWCGEAPNLEQVAVQGTGVTGDFASGKRFAKVYQFRLISTSADDSIAPMVAQMVELRSLVLVSTPVSGKILEVAANLPHLERIIVKDTHIKIADIETFREKRPEVRILFSTGSQ